MPERGDAIVLVGFMGSGKSSVGCEIAARIGLPRYDTDELICARFGLRISQIFQRHGEAAFRAAETETLRELPRGQAVIVTGGGVVLLQENVDLLRSMGLVINLVADEETLFDRATRRKVRPLLQTPDPRATLSELLRVRAPLYAAAADATLDTSSLGRGQVAGRILEIVSELRAHAR